MGSIISKVINRPVVKVTKIKFRGASPDSGKISTVVTVSITNHNPFALYAGSFEYRVSKKLNGRMIAKGHGQPFVVLGHGNVTEVTTPVEFSAIGLGSAGKSLIMSGSMDLVFSGSMTFNTLMGDMGNVTVPFSKEKVIVMDRPDPMKSISGQQQKAKDNIDKGLEKTLFRKIANSSPVSLKRIIGKNSKVINNDKGHGKKLFRRRCTSDAENDINFDNLIGRRAAAGCCGAI